MGLSQQVAYSSLLAFFPAMIALIAFLDLIGAYGALLDFLDPIAPKSVTSIIHQLERDTGNASVVLVALGIFGALWAGSGAMSSVVKAVNRAYDREETRPLWKVRLISLVLAARLRNRPRRRPAPDRSRREARGRDRSAGRTRATRSPGSGTSRAGRSRSRSCSCCSRFIYYLGPNHEQRRWRWISLGSIVGSLMWLVLSGLFALYTSFSSSYTRTYGSLASGIVLLLWLNYSAWAVLFGAELNSELDRRRGAA